MSLISRIFSGAVRIWSLVEKEIEDDFAKVKDALPASAQPDLDAMKSELKQAASDALSAAAGSALVYAPAATKAVENAADGALAALTGGLSTPLNPLLNSGIEQIEGHLVAAIRGWALKAKASAVPGPSVAANTAITAAVPQGGLNAPGNF